MSFHSDMSSKKSLGFRRDDRIIDFFGKKIKSEGHSSSSISPVRKVKSPKLRSKSRERPSSSSSPIQAKKVTFYRNGDPFFKGVVLAISTKIYPSIDSLILDANRHPICDVSVLPKGIRFVFSTDGKLITSLDELEEGKGYVFSSTETFKPLQYGGVNPLLLRSRLPADIQHNMLSYSSFQREERDQRELTVQESCDFIRTSRTIYVIRAGPRPRYTTKMILFGGTNVSLGQVIDSMEQKLFMSKGGIKHLCSVSGNEVKCLKDLFVEDTIFIAFTTEVISPDDLLLSAAEISTSPPSGSKPPSLIVWTNNLPRFPSDIKKPKIVTVVNRGHAGDERGIPFALLSKYRVSKTVIWTDCAVMKRCYTKTDSRQAIAMKIFDKSRFTSDELDAIYYELSILRRLKHSNILHYFDEMDTIPELYMLVEYFMGKNLFDAILLSEVFTERDAAHLMAQLCSAISYLHSLSIIHRNIKPDNILVSCDRPGVWHLRLVGLASAVQITEDSVSELCGTLEYAAPEMLQGISYGSKVDIWSAGVICYQMLCGLLPFRCEESGDQQQLIQRILAAHVDFPSPFWDLISDSAKDLVLHMLTRNPKLRCKASDVFNHSWLQKTPSHLFILRGKNVNLRNAIVTNLEISNNPWASKTAKSCDMLLASSFCSPRKAYEERASSPDQEARRSLSSQSAPSCSDSDQSLLKLSASPKGYRYISCPSDVGANQNDVVYGDTNQSQSSLDRDSLPTDRTIRHSRAPNNIESSGFDFGSSQLSTDQSNSQPCVRVGVDSVKTDAASGKFDSSHFCHDISASALRGTDSSISDIFSVNSVSTDNTSSSDRRIISAVKQQPCSASTQTTSSELVILPAVQTIDAADILSSSSSATVPTVVELRHESEVTYPGMTSPRSRLPFPLSLFFSTNPSASPVIQTSPAQSKAGSVNTDYQLMTAQMCSASLNGGLPSGHDSSSGRLTNAKSSTGGSASSNVHPAHMENRILLPDQSSTPSDGQTSSPPVLAFAPSKPLPPAFNQPDLPMLQFAPSTKSAVPPKLSQLQHVPSSSPRAKTSMVSNLPIPQHTTHTYQQNQLLNARSFPQYASDPVHDSQHIQTLTRSSLQSSQAPIEQPSNISEKMLQHGFSPRPKESNFHPVHRHQHSVNHASISTEVDQPKLTATHASPSQMMTAALKVFDPEDQQGHVKDARLSSGNQKPNMNMAKVAVETVCWTSSNPQKSVDKEQRGKSDVPSTMSPAACNKGDSPSCNKGDSPASSSSSHDEFLSPSSSLHNGGSDNSSQTCLSGFSEGDNDDAGSTSSWSTHCSIKNAR